MHEAVLSRNERVELRNYREPKNIGENTDAGLTCPDSPVIPINVFAEGWFAFRKGADNDRSYVN